MLEGDSMVIIKASLDDHNSLSPIGPLIEDAKFSLKSFDQLLYSHTKRECISVAYSLARYAVDIPNFLV